MPNIVKYNLSTSPNSIQSGNFNIGVNNTPTNLSEFYTGICPIIGGYTIYINKASNGPSIYAPKNDTQLIEITNNLGGNVTTAEGALVWLNSQSTMTVLNNNYPSIVTSGLVLNLDAGFVSSYPKTGTTWRDLSGNGNNGTLVNGVGFSGGSMVFDGVDDRVQLANPITLSQTSDWTLQVWVKSNQTLSGKTYLRLINLNTGGGSNYLFFEWNNRIIGNNSLGTGFVFQTGWTPGLPLDNSTFLLTLVGRGGFLEVYSNLTKTTVNAQLRGDLTFNNLMNANNVFPPGGSINSFMYYNRALSQQEIQQNYYAGLQRFIPTDGLVLSLDAQNTNLYATSPTTAYDISGNENNGTLVNGTQYVGDGDGSWSFDGVNDRINFSNLSSNQWSVSSYVKFNFPKIRSSQVFNLTSNVNGNRVGSIFFELAYSISISSLTIDSNDNIFVGGRISEYNGINQELLLKLNPNGDLITDFNAGLFNNQTQDITDIILDSNNNLYYVGYNLGALRRINATTGTFLQGISNANGTITQANLIIDETNNKAYIGGWFTSIQGVSAQRIARLNLPSMTIDTSFDSTTGFVNSEDVRVMRLQPDGKLLVAGSFISYKGVNFNRIIRLNSDASIDNTFNVGNGFNDTVWSHSMVLQPDGKILVGGFFTTYQGVSSNRIIRLNSDGSIDTSFNIGSGFGGAVKVVTLQPDGKILVGGEFGSYNGTQSRFIARLNTDGSIDTTFNIGSGFNAGVTSIRLQSNGKIIVGGVFNGFSGVNVLYLVRLNSNGTLDTDFISNTNIFGAYRLNNQVRLRNSSNILTTASFYGISRPISYDWRRYETAISVLQNFTHYTITKDSSNIYRIYWNGILSGTNTQTTSLDTSIDINSTGIPTGVISQISIYNRELTQSEITTIFNATKSRYGIQ